MFLIEPGARSAKWAPVLRSIARQYIDLAHDLVGEPLTLRRIMR
jgi:hypothetical protein